MLVKNPKKKRGPATIHYSDIGDYLTREEKLARIARVKSVSDLEPVEIITPNAHGDWLNQRRDDFGQFLALFDKDEGPAVLALGSGGVVTTRDAWVYASARQLLEEKVKRSIDFYNGQVKVIEEGGERKFSRDRAQRSDVETGKIYTFDEQSIRRATYRPFFTQWIYFNRRLNNTDYQLPALFPAGHPNVGFYCAGAVSAVPFSVLMTESIPDRHVTGAGSGGSYFARWRYEPIVAERDVGRRWVSEDRQRH